MRINITARHFKLSEELKNHTKKEVTRLNRYYDGIIDVEVILSWEKFYRMAEINLSVYGTVLTAKKRTRDMKKSINVTVNKLERKVIKYKDRLRGFEHEKIIDEQLQQEDELLQYESEESFEYEEI